jgi:broad specificity phosphatase PhoE
MLTPPSSPARLYLVRHGEVEERYHKIFGGCQIDMGLSELGKTQAQSVADWLSTRGVTRIHASPMLRVRQTMQPTLTASAMEPTFHDGLREMDFGKWTGHRWEEIQEHFGVSAYEWLDIAEKTGFPEGESTVDLMARVEPALQRILDSSADQTVAIFCHGGIIRVLLAIMLEVPLTVLGRVEIDYCSVSEVHFRQHPKHPLIVEGVNYCPWKK